MNRYCVITQGTSIGHLKVLLVFWLVQ